MKKWLFGAVWVLAAALFLMPAPVYAAPENACWTKAADGWVLQDDEGTDLTARMRGNKLYIQGTGAVPSYTRDYLGNRPWHNQTVYEIEIGTGVTSIGAEAFSNFRNLSSVVMPVSVFIEDASAFGGANEGAYFYINGTDIVSRDIGRIPYTSYDSIVAFMERYNHNYRYRVANYYMILLAQSKTNGTLANISPSDALTTAYNAAYPYIDLGTAVSVVGGAASGMNASAVGRQQGTAALEVFSIVIGDNAYIGAYNITLEQNGRTVRKTGAPVSLVMTIPAAYRLPGRQFSLIQLGAGVVNILPDEDADDNTITFTTDYPSTTYALVYQEAAATNTDIVNGK